MFGGVLGLQVQQIGRRHVEGADLRRRDGARIQDLLELVVEMLALRGLRLRQLRLIGPNVLRRRGHVGPRHLLMRRCPHSEPHETRARSQVTKSLNCVFYEKGPVDLGWN